MNDPLRAGSMVEPNILIPKTIGLLNVIFGVALLGCGMCYAFYVPGLASLSKVIEQKQREEKARKVASRKADLDALRVQEANAVDEASRASVRAEIARIESVPEPPIVDLGFRNFGFDDRRVLGHFVADAGSGLLLNLLLFVSGIGLLRRSEWGRRMGVGLAWAKLLRLGLVTASLLLVVRPIVAKNSEAFFRGLNPPPANAGDVPAAEEAVRDQVAGVDQVVLSAGIATPLFGMIYPVLSIALLGLPSARAACRPRRRYVED